MRQGFWRRITALVAVLGFVIGTSGQAFPRIVASQPCAMMMTTFQDMAASGDDGASSSLPAAGKVAPICIDAGGCVVSVTLAAVETPNWIAVQWTPVAYWQSNPTLAGRAVGPELDPPIFTWS